MSSAPAGLEAARCGATLLWLRAPDLATGALAGEARLLAQRSPVPVVVSARCDIALATGVGVHLPEHDLPVEAARRLLPAALLGRSVHSLEGALAAERGGADYAVLGPVFPTRSHVGEPGIGLAGFARVARQVRIPMIGIGGLDPARARPLAGVGGAGFAAIGYWQSLLP
ncbi:MAG: thiamine phosphate synthase [Candidatus Dormiibacterota bacterium]